MTAEFGSDWSDDPTEGRTTLPEDAIVILGRLGADYQMIRCQSPTDSPVWHFDECNPKLRLVHDSVTDWLNALADQAEAAMAEGYYDQYPDGTGP